MCPSKWNTPANSATAIRPWTINTLVFAITQSGETADTLAALREMKRKGCPTLGICNVVGSTIAQESDGGVYLRAGPEIGVASTKAFTSQCTVLAMLALFMGRLRHLSFSAGMRIIKEFEELPDKVSGALECNNAVRKIANKYAECNNFLYLGRQFNFPTALEGALKLKEISYIHAEGYPSAEMKHGPIALVDERTPSVFIMPQGQMYDKVMSNLQEIKARGGPVIAVVCQGDREAVRLADDIIEVPAVEELFQPIVIGHSPATSGLSHRRGPRLRHRQAPKPGQKRDRGVKAVRCVKSNAKIGCGFACNPTLLPAVNLKIQAHGLQPVGFICYRHVIAILLSDP